MSYRILFIALALLAAPAAAGDKTDLPCRFLEPVASSEDIEATYEEVLGDSKKKKDEKEAILAALYADGETFDESVLEHLTIQIDEWTSAGYAPFDTLVSGRGKGAIKSKGRRDWFEVSARLCRCRTDGRTYRMRAFAGDLMLASVEWTAGRERRVDIVFTVVPDPVVRAHVLREEGVSPAAAAAAIAQEFALDAQTTLAALNDAGYTAADAAIAALDEFGMSADALTAYLAQQRDARTQEKEAGLLEMVPRSEEKKAPGNPAGEVAEVLATVYGMSAEEIVGVIAGAIDKFAEGAEEAWAGVAGFLEDSLGVSPDEICALLLDVADAPVVAKALAGIGWAADKIADGFWGVVGASADGAVIVAQALADAFDLTPEDMAAILSSLTGAVEDIGDALRIVYEMPIRDIVEILVEVAPDVAAEIRDWALETLWGLRDLALDIEDQVQQFTFDAVDLIADVILDPLAAPSLIVAFLDDHGVSASATIEGLKEKLLLTALEAAQVLVERYDLDEVAAAVHAKYATTKAQLAAILEDLGASGQQMAGILRDVAGATAAEVAAILKDLGNSAAEIAGIVKGAFSATAQSVAAILADLQYTTTQILSAVQAVFAEIDTPAEAAALLKSIGVAHDAIAQILKDEFDSTAAAAAAILDDLGASAAELGGILKNVFGTTASAAAGILQNLGASANEIGGVLKDTFQQTASQAASILNVIGSSLAGIVGVLDDIYGSTASQIASTLKGLGKSAGQVASALKAKAYGNQAIASALWAASFTLGQIVDALKNTLGLGFDAIVGLLDGLADYWDIFTAFFG